MLFPEGRRGGAGRQEGKLRHKKLPAETNECGATATRIEILPWDRDDRGCKKKKKTKPKDGPAHIRIILFP